MVIVSSQGINVVRGPDTRIIVFSAGKMIWGHLDQSHHKCDILASKNKNPGGVASPSQHSLPWTLVLLAKSSMPNSRHPPLNHRGGD